MENDIEVIINSNRTLTSEIFDLQDEIAVVKEKYEEMKMLNDKKQQRINSAISLINKQILNATPYQEKRLKEIKEKLIRNGSDNDE